MPVQALWEGAYIMDMSAATVHSHTFLLADLLETSQIKLL